MEKTRRCWSCKKVVPLRGMRYDISGKDLICTECLAKERSGEKGKMEQNNNDVKNTVTTGSNDKIANIANIDDINIKIRNSDDDEKTVSYQCGGCGFGFSKERGAVIENCPYCGKARVRTAFRDSTQKLIDETEKEKFVD